MKIYLAERFIQLYVTLNVSVPYWNFEIEIMRSNWQGINVIVLINDQIKFISWHCSIKFKLPMNKSDKII